jgi:hypothetical protein
MCDRTSEVCCFGLSGNDGGPLLPRNIAGSNLFRLDGGASSNDVFRLRIDGKILETAAQESHRRGVCPREETRAST